jgi:hypothetical protein
MTGLLRFAKEASVSRKTGANMSGIKSLTDG